MVCCKAQARPCAGFLWPGALQVREEKCDEPPGLLPSSLFFLYFRNLVSHIWSFHSKRTWDLSSKNSLRKQKHKTFENTKKKLKSSYRIFCPSCTVNIFPRLLSHSLHLHDLLHHLRVTCRHLSSRPLVGPLLLLSLGLSLKTSSCRTCPPRLGEGFVLAQSSCLPLQEPEICSL